MSTTDFDGLTIILEKELVDIAKEAYKTGAITGNKDIPSYAVVLNKIKAGSKDYNIVEDCVNLKHKLTLEKELENIEALNKMKI